MTLNAAGSGYSRERLSRAYRNCWGVWKPFRACVPPRICGYTPMAGVGAMRPATVEGYQAKPGRRRFLSELGRAAILCDLRNPPAGGARFQFSGPRPPARGDRQSDAGPLLFRRRATPSENTSLFDGDSQPFEIVGVVGDAKSGDLRESALRSSTSTASSGAATSRSFALRTSVDPEAVAGDVRRVVRGLLKTVAVEKVTTLADQVDGAIVPERLIAMLSGLFSALGPCSRPSACTDCWPTP